MGIRFRCHYCEHELHVKDFQAGKRGRCPQCSGRFRIPTTDSLHSLPLEPAIRGQNGVSSEESVEATSETTSLVKEQPLIRSASATASPSTLLGPEQDQSTLDAPANESSATALAAIREAPGAVWYIRPPSGGQYGPAAAEILCQWMAESRITRDSLVWRDGWAEWLVAAKVFPDFFGPEAAGSVRESIEQPKKVSVVGESMDRIPAASTPLIDRTRKPKRRKRKSSYALAIGFLTFLAIALVIALVVVLVMQQSGTTQPSQ